MPIGRRRVSLVLGGGGARGYAHIGAIEVLQQRGYEIAGVTGSSMGALVGGIHAVGKLEEYRDWALSLRHHDVLRMMDVALGVPGVMRAERVLARVRELVGDARIEQLEIPFTAVATDLLAAREVWFQRGPLDLAIRASIAMPGIFTPVMLGGRVLSDGALMEPLPVAPAAAIPADLTLAVSLSGGRDDGPPVPGETSEPGRLEALIARLRRGAAEAEDAAEAQLAPGPDDLGELPPGLTGVDVVNYALEAMQSVLGRYRLAGFPPDVLVTVPRDSCRTLDFHRAEPMIELGRQLTAEALDAFEARQARRAGGA